MTGVCSRCGTTGTLARQDRCRPCYQRDWRAGTLPPLPASRTYAQPADCAHDGRPHRHGTRVAYVWDRCRCQPCTEASRISQAERRRLQAMAVWNPDSYDLVDGDLVRAHLRQLMAAGMGWKRVAAAAGVGASTVYPILYGKWIHQPEHPQHRPPRKQVTKAVADKLLAVTLDLADGRQVDATGTRRRLQALAAVGWPQVRLAELIGWNPGNFHQLIHNHQRHTTKNTAELVTQLYDQHWQGPPAATTPRETASIERARRVAASHGWAPPLAWDDDSIDDPDATPDLGGKTAAITTDDGMITAATIARIENTRDLLDAGETPEHIAARLGVNIETLTQSLLRHAPDLVAPFQAACSRQRRTTAA